MTPPGPRGDPPIDNTTESTRWDELVEAFMRGLQDHGRSPHTIATYRSGLSFWRQAFWRRDPATLEDPETGVTLDAVREILRSPDSLRLKPRTRRIRVQALDGLIRSARRRGEWRGDNPIRRLPKTRIRQTLPVYWTIPAARDFLQKIPDVSSCPYRDVAIFRMYLATGLRLMELIRLRRDDVDWTGHRVHVLGKGGKWRWVPLTDALETDLRRYLETRRDESPVLFLAPGEKSFSPSGMEKLFQRLRARTGHNEPGLSIRNLRHTALSALLHEGLDLVSIQTIAGHDKLTTTEGYLHLEPQAIVSRVRAQNPWDKS